MALSIGCGNSRLATEICVKFGLKTGGTRERFGIEAGGVLGSRAMFTGKRPMIRKVLRQPPGVGFESSTVGHNLIVMKNLMKLRHLIPCLLLPLSLFAGDPIPGIDITVNQSPGGAVATGTTGEDGSVILSGLKPGGRCTVALSHQGRLAVLGSKKHDAITIPANTRAGIKPIRLEVSLAASSKKGYDYYQSKSDAGSRAVEDPVVRKRPGAKLKNTTADNFGGTGTKAQDHNSSRSNKTSSVAARGSDGVVVETGARQLVEITPLGDGRLKIRVTGAD